eukprot:31072-Pelagococcus_subviridis.AAC.9
MCGGTFEGTYYVYDYYFDREYINTRIQIAPIAMRYIALCSGRYSGDIAIGNSGASAIGLLGVYRRAGRAASGR